jgi:type I restriction enzyme S subunit
MKQDWPTKRLAEVCQILGGATPSKKNPKFYGGDIPWATVGDMNVEVITTTEEYITKAGVADCSTNVIPSGSIVVATRVGLGKVCVLGQDTAINQDLKGLTPKNTKELTTRWLFWWLKSKASDIQKAGTGATVQGVKMTFVQELEIPLPPLAEQKRIVALLDEAFAGIDEAKANAEANQENAIALFQSYLNSVFAQCGETWTEKPLGEVLVKTETIDPTRTPRAEFDYIDVSSVSKDELVVQQTQRLLGKDAPSRARKLVRANDVIFATIRPTLRRIAIVPGELDGQVCSTGYFVLRPKGEIDHRWVFYFLQTGSFLAEMEMLQKGASYPAVTDNDVRSQMIPIPSLGEQKKALEKLDDLRKESLALSRLYEKKVLNLAKLKSSLLTQAFAGELTS